MKVHLFRPHVAAVDGNSCFCVPEVVVVLQQVFALIQTVLSKWLNDSQVVEVSSCCRISLLPCVSFTCQGAVFLPLYLRLQAVCAIFEKSVKTLLHDFAPMVSQLSEMLGQMYSTIPQASALDLTRQVRLSPRLSSQLSAMLRIFTL